MVVGAVDFVVVVGPSVVLGPLVVVGGTGANTFADLIEGDILYFQRQNPDLDLAWPGDPDYLKSKF